MLKVFKDSNECIKNLPDIFYSYDYIKLWAKYIKGEPYFVVFEEQLGRVLMSFIKRRIEGTKFYDITAPYGCGGIHIEGDKKDILLTKFYEEFKKFCDSENIISEFMRIHPYYFDSVLIRKNFLYNHVTHSVFIDLKDDLKKIEKKFRKGHRAIIKKTRREGVEIKILRNEGTEIFHKLYITTMERRNTSQFYFFSLWFIKEFFKNFRDSYIFIAYYKNLPIAASMFLGYNKFFHYYLSGSDFNYRKLGATHLIIYEAIRFAKEKGFEIMHLGGGMKGKDSLFLFKSGFSDWHLPYYVYGVVHNKEIYNKLVEERKKRGPLAKDFYFPLYRAPLPDKI